MNGKKWPWFFIGLYAALTGAKLIWLNAGMKEKTDMRPSNALDVESNSIPPIDAAAPEKFETAAFAMGWFWGPDSQFGSMPGVIRTRVGYAGGTTPNPTYHNLADYSETIQLDYDPEKLSYQDLLDVFWESQNPPTSPPISRQYMSIIFYHDETQQRLAQASLKKQEEKLGKQLYVEILPDDTFHLAEDYHQKYRLRSTKLIKDELLTVYDEQGFVNSTAAARINAYLGGYGSRAQYQREAGSFGLSEAARQELDRLVAMWKK